MRRRSRAWARRGSAGLHGEGRSHAPRDLDPSGVGRRGGAGRDCVQQAGAEEPGPRSGGRARGGAQRAGRIHRGPQEHVDSEDPSVRVSQGGALLGVDRGVPQHVVLDLRAGTASHAGSRAPVRRGEAQSLGRRDQRGDRRRARRHDVRNGRTEELQGLSRDDSACGPDAPAGLPGRDDRAQPGLVHRRRRRQPDGERRLGEVPHAQADRLRRGGRRREDVQSRGQARQAQETHVARDDPALCDQGGRRAGRDAQAHQAVAEPLSSRYVRHDVLRRQPPVPRFRLAHGSPRRRARSLLQRGRPRPPRGLRRLAQVEAAHRRVRDGGRSRGAHGHRGDARRGLPGAVGRRHPHDFRGASGAPRGEAALPRDGGADRPVRAPPTAPRPGRSRQHSRELRGRLPRGTAGQAAGPTVRPAVGESRMTAPPPSPPLDRLPVLPLGQLVVYPHVVLPLALDDPNAVQLIDEVVQGNKRLLLGVVRPLGGAEPVEGTVMRARADELYEVGTLAILVRMLKLGDGSARVMVQGLERARFLEVEPTDHWLVARYETLPETVVEDARTEALKRTVHAQFSRVIDIAPYLGEELHEVLAGITDAGKLADFIAANLDLALPAKAELLAISDVNHRLERLTDLLGQELQVLEVGSQIQEKVKSRLDASQREYVLREQLRVIRQELGEDQEDDELDELGRRLEETGLSAEAKKVADRELKRLRQMSPQSAEYHVARTYLDVMASLPWNRVSQDREYLAVRTLNPKAKGSILCFVGPPGVGKTSLGQSIAEALGRRFTRVSLGG